MKKLSSAQMSRFFLFALPCYWLLAIIFIALAIWKVGFDEPDLFPIALVSIAILVSSVFLTKKHDWICFPMILMGICIFFTMWNDQHVGYIVPLYGIYLVLHYLACWFYVLKHWKHREPLNHEASAHKDDRLDTAILYITIIFAFSILFTA